MQSLRLRWTPRQGGWFVIPGDEILESGAKPFRVDWNKLIGPDLFRQASMEHDWPPLSVNDHRERLKHAVSDKDIADGIHPGCREQVVLLSLALVNDELTLEEYFDLMEKMTP